MNGRSQAASHLTDLGRALLARQADGSEKEEKRREYLQYVPGRHRGYRLPAAAGGPLSSCGACPKPWRSNSIFFLTSGSFVSLNKLSSA